MFKFCPSYVYCGHRDTIMCDVQLIDTNLVKRSIWNVSIHPYREIENNTKTKIRVTELYHSAYTVNIHGPFICVRVLWRSIIYSMVKKVCRRPSVCSFMVFKFVCSVLYMCRLTGSEDWYIGASFGLRHSQFDLSFCDGVIYK